MKKLLFLLSLIPWMAQAQNGVAISLDKYTPPASPSYTILAATINAGTVDSFMTAPSQPIVMLGVTLPAGTAYTGAGTDTSRIWTKCTDITLHPVDIADTFFTKHRTISKTFYVRFDGCYRPGTKIWFEPAAGLAGGTGNLTITVYYQSASGQQVTGGVTDLGVRVIAGDSSAAALIRAKAVANAEVDTVRGELADTARAVVIEASENMSDTGAVVLAAAKLAANLEADTVRGELADSVAGIRADLVDTVSLSSLAVMKADSTGNSPGNYITRTSMLGSNYFTIQCVTANAVIASPADSSAYYFSNVLSGANTSAISKWGVIAVKSKLVGYSISTIGAGSCTQEKGAVSFILNNSSSQMLTNQVSWSNTANEANNYTAMNLSKDVEVGDTWTLKLLNPTWATNATQIYMAVILYFQVRQ